MFWLPGYNAKIIFDKPTMGSLSSIIAKTLYDYHSLYILQYTLNISISYILIILIIFSLNENSFKTENIRLVPQAP